MQRIKIRRIGKQLQAATVEIPHTFTGVRKVASACIEPIESLECEVAALFDLGVWTVFNNPTSDMTDTDITKLMALNRQLRTLEQFIQAVPKDIGGDVDFRIQYLVSKDTALCPNGEKIVLTERKESRSFCST